MVDHIFKNILIKYVFYFSVSRQAYDEEKTARNHKIIHLTVLFTKKQTNTFLNKVSNISFCFEILPKKLKS